MNPECERYGHVKNGTFGQCQRPSCDLDDEYLAEQWVQWETDGTVDVEASELIRERLMAADAARMEEETRV